MQTAREEQANIYPIVPDTHDVENPLKQSGRLTK